MNAFKTGIMTLLYYFIGTPFLVVLIPIFLRYLTRLSAACGKLKGKVVLITGASSGLGEALSHELYKQGCKLILAARRLEQLERVKADLLALSCTTETFTPEILVLDLANLDALPAVADKAVKLHGSIDILINNGGISLRGSILDTVMEVHQRIMMTNYFGSICLTKSLLPSFIAQKSGHIVMINSIQGKISIPFRSAYGAAKHALQAYSDSLRAEVGKSGINVITITAGYINTNLSANALTAEGNQYAKKDEATSEGYQADYVARRIVTALKFNENEVIISPLIPKLAIIIRTLFPDLYFLLMKKRADKMT